MDLQLLQELFLLSSLLKFVSTLCHLAVQFSPLVTQVLKPGLYVIPGKRPAVQQLSRSLEWRQRPMDCWEY